MMEGEFTRIAFALNGMLPYSGCNKIAASKYLITEYLKIVSLTIIQSHPQTSIFG